MITALTHILQKNLQMNISFREKGDHKLISKSGRFINFNFRDNAFILYIRTEKRLEKYHLFVPYNVVTTLQTNAGCSVLLDYKLDDIPDMSADAHIYSRLIRAKKDNNKKRHIFFDKHIILQFETPV